MLAGAVSALAAAALGAVGAGLEVSRGLSTGASDGRAGTTRCVAQRGMLDAVQPVAIITATPTRASQAPFRTSAMLEYRFPDAPLDPSVATTREVRIRTNGRASTALSLTVEPAAQPTG
jgi:hypothetical protein